MNHLDLPLSDPLIPTLELQVLGNLKTSQLGYIETVALVDTGFNDFLTIPYTLAKELGLEVIGKTDVQLADGSEVTTKIAVGEIILPDVPKSKSIVDIHLSAGDNEFIIGTRLLEQIAQSFRIDFDNNILSFENLRD